MTALARRRPTLTIKETSPRAISLLPEVKCTSCGSPVPLDELGDHECSPARKPPASAPPSPSSSRVSRPIQPPNKVPRTILSTAPTRTPSPRTPSPSPSRSLSSPRSNTPTIPRTPPPPLQSLRTATSDQPSRTTSNPDSPSPSNTSLSPYGTVKSTRSVSTAPQILTNASDDVPNTSRRSAATPEPLIPQPDSLEVPTVSFYAPDTKSGGQAGMAGVGRRAFAAVAHAALLSNPTSFANHSAGNDSTALPISRSQTPQYLEVNSIGGRSTPSLSSPRSSPSPRIPDPSRTPSPGPPVRNPSTSLFRHQHDSVHLKSAPVRKVSVDSTASETELAYFSTRTPPPALVDPNKTLPLISDSTYSKDSIAFPSQGSYSDRRSPASSVASSYTSPMPNEDRSSASGESDLVETRRDSLASISQYSSMAMKIGSALRASKSTGAMGSVQPPRQHLETLAEENGGLASSSALPLVVEGLKLPVRSKTAPGPTAPTTRRKRSIKTCVRCGIVIDDGRWVAIDNGKGGVLCEKDWKEMYLPKCRRCGLTIESQAVSSADGQLKGKYHRECFSCSTCQKPFPDKSFYVFGGQPYCDYHYHQANNSLCANPMCGKPIEGPCAEDHEGCRYHPEHLTCAAQDCRERLVDYYEVDGVKYCDKHIDSHRDGSTGSSGHADIRGVRWLMGEDTPSRGEGDRQAPSSNGLTSAMKRRTRFLEI